MKRIKAKAFLLFIGMVFVMATFITGCGKNEKKTAESWAYNFEDTAEVLRFDSDGTAFYLAKEYENGVQVKKEKNFSSYNKDDSYYTLKSSNGEELKFRYLRNDDGMVIYEKSTYKYSSVNTEAQNGVLGVWINPEFEKYYFEFTSSGTFMEDGIFAGYYEVNESEGTIKLKYNDPVPDTVFYYQINGDEMTVEYPWQLVPTNKQ
jgi:hypothetical protein